jgi:nicotinamidase-related amidase
VDWDALIHGALCRDVFESNPLLAGRLKAGGVRRIVAFGIQSEGCVLETARGALDAGFELVLLGGAHSTYDAKAKTAIQLEADVETDILERGGKVIPWEEWIP